jgi:hypothetical protein
MREKRFHRRGVAPKRIRFQVENTAAWALEGETGNASWRAHLLAAEALEDSWHARESGVAYLRLSLSAHFATVATLVPTDLDAHIRYHLWQEMESEAELSAALAVVDEAAAWDPRPVSARVVEIPGHAPVHGHAGEWLAVRAGALGRALELRADDVADRLEADIDRELVHEASAFARAREIGDPVLALKVATTLAHNGGDLSRVVEAYAKGTPRKEQMIARFAKLGHEDSARYAGEHHLAGHVNKAVMATENHRFLPMRAARSLRAARELILPIAPFFDAWGERVAMSEALELRGRAEALGVLLAAHETSPELLAYQRALAGLDRSFKGGLTRIADELPARARRVVLSGSVRAALGTSEERFLGPVVKAYRSALASYRAAGVLA